VFAQDLTGNIRIQGEASMEISFVKAPTFGENTTPSPTLSEQRKNLPIYKLREPLLQAIREVWFTDVLI
jgi:ATP-dependent RNA helicase DHX8/PRP22